MALSYTSKKISSRIKTHLFMERPFQPGHSPEGSTEQQQQQQGFQQWQKNFSNGWIFFFFLHSFFGVSKYLWHLYPLVLHRAAADEVRLGELGGCFLRLAKTRNPWRGWLYKTRGSIKFFFFFKERRRLVEVDVNRSYCSRCGTRLCPLW